MAELRKNPVHLGLGALATTEPNFTGDMAWYADYAERHADDDIEGRLVSMHTFESDWDVWEMHPKGHEVVVVTAGTMRLHQETDGDTVITEVSTGEYAINSPGVWHTADVVGSSATALFITAGLGTEHRPR